MFERPRRRDLLLILGLAAVTYHFAFFHQWAMDDTHFILRNRAVIGGVNLPLLRAVETEGGVFYRPLAIALFSVMHALFGATPGPMHALALVGHALASCLVAALGARLSNRWAGVAAGCLFAVHPVHVEAVASITNSTEVYATACWLGALWIWASRGVEPSRAGVDMPQDQVDAPSAQSRSRALLGVYGLGLAGMLFKESGITLPAAMFVLERTWPFRARRPVATGAALSATITYLALRYIAVRGVFVSTLSDPLRSLPPADAVRTILRIVGRYGELLLVPQSFAADYRAPVFTPATSVDGTVFVGGLVLGGLTAALIAALRCGTAWSVGIAWTFVGTALYLHVLPIEPWMAERFLYLPSAGLCITLGVGLARLGERLRSMRLAKFALVGVCLWFGALAANRNLDWSSFVTLWGADVENHGGGSAFARANYGLALIAVGQRPQGTRALESAVCDRDGTVQYAAELGRQLSAQVPEERAASLARLRACMSPGDARSVALARGLGRP